MHWRNQETHWGLTAVFLHFLVAFTIFGLFALGWWMTDLTYYDPWYKQGPFIHKSIGILLFMGILLRLAWRYMDPSPAKLASHTKWEQQAAKAMHLLLYVLILTILSSGYLISTADGREISVFGWFAIPATLQSIPKQEVLAGYVHWLGACILMGLVGLHIAGALKHQLIDKDGTLTRMLGRAPK